MIIKDIEGVRYRLSKKKLSGLYSAGHPAFYIFLADVSKTPKYPGDNNPNPSVQLWLGNSGPGYYVRVTVDSNSIGCRTFDRKTFAIIKKAIKAAKQ